MPLRHLEVCAALRPQTTALAVAALGQAADDHPTNLVLSEQFARQRDASLWPELKARLEKVAVESGLEPEPRAFRAHLTLGRVRARRFPALDAPALAAAQLVRAVVLFRSDLAREGAQYTPLATLALGAGAEPRSPH